MAVPVGVAVPGQWPCLVVAMPVARCLQQFHDSCNQIIVYCTLERIIRIVRVGIGSYYWHLALELSD